MDMNTATLPKKGLKTRPYSMDMEDHIVTLHKKSLKTRPHSIDMNIYIYMNIDMNIYIYSDSTQKRLKDKTI